MTSPVPAFAAIAAALFDAAGAAQPPLVPDSHGGFGLHLEIDGVAVSVTHYPAHFPDHAFVLVRFGAVNAMREADALRELLDANLVMLRPGGPAFARDPVDGSVLLQVCCPLAQADGHALLAGIRLTVERAIEWRRANRLSPSSMDTGHLFGTQFA